MAKVECRVQGLGLGVGIRVQGRIRRTSNFGTQSALSSRQELVAVLAFFRTLTLMILIW